MLKRLGLGLLLLASLARAETFRVATYNLENYLTEPTEARPFVKSAEAKAKICESIRAVRPDVIALEEIGSTNALLELHASLEADGLDFPYWEHVIGPDPNIHVAVLSKFPFTARRSHTNENFLLDGRRFHVSRGIAELDVQVNPKFSFTLIAGHLKSRRAVPEADEGAMRLEEAKILRGFVDADLLRNPSARLIVLGDFNDAPNSESTKALIGHGRFKLVDTRPAERNGDNAPSENPAWEPRNITWTHYYGIEDSYSRIDYILLSPAMARELIPKETYIATIPNWGAGSDHRIIVAAFGTGEK